MMKSCLQPSLKFFHYGNVFHALGFPEAPAVKERAQAED